MTIDKLKRHPIHETNVHGQIVGVLGTSLPSNEEMMSKINEIIDVVNGLSEEVKKKENKPVPNPFAPRGEGDRR
jgi:hypothetical protein